MKPVFIVQLTFSLVVVAANKHVIYSPRLAQSLELGEVLAEKTVESAAACGQLCAANSVCHTVMLIGQQCLLFAYLHSHCPAEVTTLATSYCPSPFAPISTDLTSRYVIGQDPSVTSFGKALDYCQSLGGYSVHIESSTEHWEIVKHIEMDAGLTCGIVWTGGWTDHPGADPEASNWKWITSFSDPDPVPITYMDWIAGEPNNIGGAQCAIVLAKWGSYKFDDIGQNEELTSCYVCECQ